MNLGVLAMDERMSDAFWGAGILVVLVLALLLSMFWPRSK